MEKDASGIKAPSQKKTRKGHRSGPASRQSKFSGEEIKDADDSFFTSSSIDSKTGNKKDQKGSLPQGSGGEASLGLAKSINNSSMMNVAAAPGTLNVPELTDATFAVAKSNHNSRAGSTLGNAKHSSKETPSMKGG